MFMENKLKRIMKMFKNDPDFEIKFVKSWIFLGGQVDSAIYKYEEVIKENEGYVKILPVLIERKK
jgi:hypothetical protein